MKLQRFCPPAAAIFAVLATNASAQLIWDPDNDQINNGGAGVWDLATSNWDNDSTAPNAGWTNGSSAIFGNSGGNYTIDLDAGVSVANLSYEGTDTLQIKAIVDNTALTLSANAVWNTGGGEIEFLNNTANDTILDLAGHTLTVNGGGVFDTGEKGNNANWGSGSLVFTEATTLRGASFSVGQLSSVTMAGGSFFMERNSNQDINNNWTLNGDTTFDNRWNGRTIWANGVFSGTGRLTVQGLGTSNNSGAGFLRLNNTSNSWSGGLTVNGGLNATIVQIAGGDSVLGAAPASFEADNIILQDGGVLKMNGMNLNANRGITLLGSGVIVNQNNANTINGAITGDGSLVIGRWDDGAANTTILASNANDYQGVTRILRGELRLGVDNALPASTIVRIGGNGTSAFDMNGHDAIVGGVEHVANNTRQIENNGASVSTLTIHVAEGESYGYSANVTGSTAINIVKTGAGSQTLGRAGNYSTALGNVTVNDGTLVWNNTNGQTLGGTMTVGSGGTLAGTGTVGGVTTVAGNLNPGSSPGTLTFDENLTLQSSATLTLEFENPEVGGFDILKNDGGDTFTASGILALALFGTPDLEEGDVFQVLETWGGFAGSFDSITGTTIGGGLEFNTDTLLSNGQISVVAIPETSASLLPLLAALGFASRRRRQPRR